MNLEIISHQPKSHLKPTPILCVPGMWHGAWCWAEHFLPYFAQHGYAAHALSLRGHGQSERQGQIRWARLQDYVADVAQVVETLERPPLLIGHSMGGMIVQKYLENHTMPGAVLLASAPPHGILSSALSSAKRHPLNFLKSNLTLNTRHLVGTPALYQELFFSDTFSEETLLSYFKQLSNESTRVGYDLLGLNLPRPERIKTPMLVLGASKDKSILPQEFETTARRYHTQALMFDMAHNMMLDTGWQAVADAILAWLKEKKLS